MKTEVSAGGVVVRKSPNGWDVLLMKDMNRTWTFPKGLIEKGETPEIAAKREIGEEVGITQLQLFLPLQPIEYVYKRQGLIKKSVAYFIFTTEGKELPKPQKEEGISEIQWFPIVEAIELVGYPKTNKKLLEETISKLPE